MQPFYWKYGKNMADSNFIDYLLPDQPGNADVRTTQIYAKIVDKNKRKAVNLIPKI